MFNFFRKSTNKLIKSGGRTQGEQWKVVLNSYEDEMVFNFLTKILELGQETKGKKNSLFKYNGITAVVVPNGKIISAYFDPESYINNGKIKGYEIYEWPNKTEADIQAVINECNLSFFATDYAINKEIYLQSNEVDIELACLSAGLTEFNISEINKGEVQLSDLFTGIFPTDNTSFYSVVFDVRELSKKILTDGKEFWEITASFTSTDDPLICKVYVPVGKNEINVGRKYSAMVLLMGRIAKD